MTLRSERSQPRRAVTASLACALAIATASWSGASCTTFDGLEADPDAGDSGPKPWDPPELAWLELDDAVRLCRWVHECDLLSESIASSIAVPLDDENFSQCLHWAAGPIPPDRPGLEDQHALLSTIAGSESCEQAFAGAYVEVIDPATDPRCDQADLQTDCPDMSTAIDCKRSAIEHCDSARWAPEPAHTCFANFAVGTCVNGTCPLAGEATYECTDDVTTVCAATKTAGVRCAPLGLTCALGVTCGPDPDTIIECSVIGKSSCQTTDKDVVEVCGGLVASTYRCRDFGATCATIGKPRCAFATDVCSPADAAQNQCNGSELTACVAGQHIVFDCASVGLACLPPAGSQSGRCGTPP